MTTLFYTHQYFDRTFPGELIYKQPLPEKIHKALRLLTAVNGLEFYALDRHVLYAPIENPVIHMERESKTVTLLAKKAGDDTFWHFGPMGRNILEPHKKICGSDEAERLIGHISSLTPITDAEQLREKYERLVSEYQKNGMKRTV